MTFSVLIEMLNLKVRKGKRVRVTA